jgi:hypothetical protein
MCNVMLRFCDRNLCERSGIGAAIALRLTIVLLDV